MTTSLSQRLLVALLLAIVAVSIPAPGGTLPSADAANGCGSGWTALIFPNGDLFPYSYDFLGACNTHDDCYGTAGRSKSECDWNFRQDMLEACSEIPWYKPVRKLRCKAHAIIYFKGVDWFGNAAYLAVQMQSALFGGAYSVSRTVTRATGGWSEGVGERQSRNYFVSPGCGRGGCDVTIESSGGPQPVEFIAEFRGGTEYVFAGPGVYCNDRPARGGEEVVVIKPVRFGFTPDGTYRVSVFSIVTTFTMPDGVPCEAGFQVAEGYGIAK